MPTVQRFSNCKIAMYIADHNPPHFHIVGPGFEALVEIETMVVLRGDVSLARDAMAWAADNRDQLRSEWQRLHR